MTQQERFGKRLRQLRREKSAREERDVEQEEVAAAIGDKQPNLARWERGRIPKEDTTIQALADYYGVSFFFLRYGHEPAEIGGHSMEVVQGVTMPNPPTAEPVVKPIERKKKA